MSYNKEEAQKKRKDSLVANKLKDTVNIKILTADQKLDKAQSEVKDLMSDMFRRFKKRKKSDMFSIYMNAYTEVFDPHTTYFSPKDKEDVANYVLSDFSKTEFEELNNKIIPHVASCIEALKELSIDEVKAKFTLKQSI